MAGVAPRDDRGPIAPSGPDRAPIAPSGPDRAPIPSDPDQAPIAPPGPDRAPIAPSGPDRGPTESGPVNCTKLASPSFAIDTVAFRMPRVTGVEL